jgi:anti-sigma B factor antagonist
MGVLTGDRGELHDELRNQFPSHTVLGERRQQNKMEILERKEGTVGVISLSGRLDAYSANDMEAKLNSMIDMAQVQLAVSLERLEYISSSGLRVLLAALKKTRNQQGDIKLACLKPSIKEVFDIAGFTQLFCIFDTEESAIASFEMRH